MTWHSHYHGVTRSWPDNTIEAAVLSGEVPSTALVWTPGMDEWKPACSLFKVPSGTPTKSGIGLLAAAVLVIAALSISYGIGRAAILEYLHTYGDLFTSMFAVAALAVGLSVASFFLTFSSWRDPARRGASRAAGLIFLLATSLTFYNTVLLVSFLIEAPDDYRLISAAESAEDAAMTLSPDGTVKIEGHLGPNLMRDFSRLEENAGIINAVQITSPGGLVEPAIELARHLENQKTKVVIREQCSSACILLAVASPRSYADADMFFGFHHTFPIARTESEIARARADDLWRTYRGYLAEHGVPESVLVEAAKHDARSVYAVSAVDMVAYGAVKAIVTPSGARQR